MAAEGQGTGRSRPRPGTPRACLALGVLLLGVLLLTAAATVLAGADRDRILFGGDVDYPPYHFLDARGQADGFDIALAREVAADLGVEAVFALGSWDTTLQRLERGELDVVPMFWSSTRAQRYGLSEPILLRHHALFGHYETPTVASLDALANARVAVQGAGLAWETMRELDHPGVVLVETGNEAETLGLVAAGEVEYALVPTGIGYHSIQQEHLAGLVALSPPLLERKYVFAVRPDDPDLVHAINGSLERLRRAGVQNELYVEWLGTPGMQQAADDPPGILAPLLAALATFAISAIGFMAWRRRQAPRSGIATARAGHPAAGTASSDSVRLLAELDDAIDRGQLEFELQPKVDLGSGRLLGAELLVRWNHPRLGPIPPEAFVPAAEHARSIGRMTLYLVRQGLAHSRDWPDTGSPLHISINVSANDLADPAIVDAIIAAFDGRAPRLMLEITETEVMREPERVAEALPRLRAHGIGISVDDFGAGHSSLVNLRRLAPDELKIDCSFVSALLSSRSDRTIVRATIRLAHELNASVAAEGIEDEATRDWLFEAGCDAGQGFAIARPMPPSEFMELLRRQA